MGSTSIFNGRRQKVDIYCPKVLYVLSESVDSETRSVLCVYRIVHTFAVRRRPIKRTCCTTRKPQQQRLPECVQGPSLGAGTSVLLVSSKYSMPAARLACPYSENVKCTRTNDQKHRKHFHGIIAQHAKSCMLMLCGRYSYRSLPAGLFHCELTAKRQQVQKAKQKRSMTARRRRMLKNTKSNPLDDVSGTITTSNETSLSCTELCVNTVLR